MREKGTAVKITNKSNMPGETARKPTAEKTRPKMYHTKVNSCKWIDIKEKRKERKHKKTRENREDIDIKENRKERWWEEWREKWREKWGERWREKWKKK